jgi:hypothetical protein
VQLAGGVLGTFDSSLVYSPTVGTGWVLAGGSIASAGVLAIDPTLQQVIKNALDNAIPRLTTTTLSSAPNPAVLGQAVTLTATVGVVPPAAGTPTGTVDVYDGATKLGSGTLSTQAGVTTATFTTSALALGSHAITATYNTDGTFASSTASALTQLVGYGTKLLYKPPMSGKAGSSVPVKIALVNAAGQNVSSSSLAVQALCVVVTGAATTCSGTPPISYGAGTPFTYLASLAPGGGYQFNVKTTGLSSGPTYQLLFRAGGEDAGSFHADAKATFTLTK